MGGHGARCGELWWLALTRQCAQQPSGTCIVQLYRVAVCFHSNRVVFMFVVIPTIQSKYSPYFWFEIHISYCENFPEFNWIRYWNYCSIASIYSSTLRQVKGLWCCQRTRHRYVSPWEKGIYFFIFFYKDFGLLSSASKRSSTIFSFYKFPTTILSR